MDWQARVTDGAPPIRRWQELTGGDFAKMDRAQTVVLLSCSPIEVHGPHLPVAADVTEGDALLLRCVEKLRGRHPELDFVHMPPLGLGAQVLPRPGSLPIRAGTIEQVISELGEALAAQGFVHIWIGSFHGAPGHILALERAARRCNRNCGTKMISVFSLMLGQLDNQSVGLEEGPLKDLLGDVPGMPWEVLRGDAHAGSVETSILLHLLGRWVDPSFTTLPRRTLDEYLAERGRRRVQGRGLLAVARGFIDELAFFSDESYAGEPGFASAEAGAHILGRLSDCGADALSAVYRGALGLDACHSPLWKNRWIFANPLLARLFDLYLSWILRKRSIELQA